MARVNLTSIALILLLGSSICGRRKRLYYFRQKDAKASDYSISCCLKLINVDSRKAEIDHITGQCDTAATTNTNGTGLIQFRSLDILFDEFQAYSIETGELPPILGYEADGHNARATISFEFNATSKGVSDWTKFEFMDGIGSQLTFRVLGFDSSTALQFKLDGLWSIQDFVYLDGVDGIFNVGIRLYSAGFEVYVDGDFIKALTNDYAAFKYIRCSSNFATCNRISFSPAK